LAAFASFGPRSIEPLENDLRGGVETFFRRSFQRLSRLSLLQ